MSDDKRKFRGSGGPPPPSGGGSGGGKGSYEENPFEFQEEIGPGKRRIKPFFIAKTAKTTFTLLDKGRFNYSIMLHHRFFYNGQYGNYAVCRAKIDSRGCPLCDAGVGDPRWFVVGSGIDETKYSFDEGRNAGKVYTNLRRLLLIHRGALGEFGDMEDDEEDGVDGDWRGVQCRVKRSDEKKSPRIGSSWRTKGRMTEEQMIEKYEKVADDYEIPVEDYIAPVDYETVLAPYDYDAMKELADEIKKTDKKDDRKSSGRKEKAKSGVDENVPF